jgi:hypothetical protein
MIDRALTVAGLGLAVISIVAPSMFPRMNRKWSIAGMICGIFMLGAAAAIALLPSGEAQTIKRIQYSPSITGNCNAVGQNNSACNTYGPRKLIFSEESGQLLISKIPERKPVSLTAIGSMNDWQVAEQYQTFLARNGYKILGFSRVGVQAPPPDHKISIGVGPDHYEITIAPSAN